MPASREANENAPAGLTGVPGETSPLSRLAVTLTLRNCRDAFEVLMLLAAAIAVIRWFTVFVVP